MGLGTFFTSLISGLIGIAVPLMIWVVAFFYLLGKTKGKRGKAERLLIGGVIIGILVTLLDLPRTYVALMINDAGADRATLETISRLYTFCTELIQAGGLGLILYAFVVKFRQRNIGKEVTQSAD